MAATLIKIQNFDSRKCENIVSEMAAILFMQRDELTNVLCVNSVKIGRR